MCACEFLVVEVIYPCCNSKGHSKVTAAIEIIENAADISVMVSVSGYLLSISDSYLLT